MKYTAAFLLVILMGFQSPSEEDTWVRINFLGYKPGGTKVAVWVTKKEQSVNSFDLVDARSGKTVFTASAGLPFGAYGPFVQSYRLDFSSFSKDGRYRIVAGNATSPVFEIGEGVYKGTADFCLRYMRQQRSGFNPFFKDSCHTQDGYSLYGGRAGLKDSTHIDVSGGWHDATDYLQYSSTSANATFQMLMAWRDFPQVFGDKYAANGLEGGNGRADILDEAKWGLDWLLKMHPRPNWMFNQLADDRDHAGMRLPKMDSFYNKGYERPVYFVTGEPQQRGKFMNTTTGTSSIAGKFCSAFSLGALLLRSEDPVYADSLRSRAHSALAFSLKRPGYTQTASVKAPYIYGERNWVDDMELAYAAINRLQTRNSDQLVRAINYARQERTTPWMGRDTADHYEWYPFVNAGHYELASQLTGKDRALIIGFMKEGIELVWAKARVNAFFRGVPFIWCSNNLTTAFAMQCYWYRKLTGDSSYEKLEQACFDWLFGCNPWGTSMVYGLPSGADTPIDPHSSLTHLNNYPIDGGLVDGPIYTRTFNNLLGLHLSKPDAYAAFQSDLAVYHDDYGDYSTNEPTMDGTATLIYLLAAKEAEHARPKK